MKIVDPSGTNSIDIRKLKAFEDSETAKTQFRKFVTKLREELDQTNQSISV